MHPVLILAAVGSAGLLCVLSEITLWFYTGIAVLAVVAIWRALGLDWWEMAALGVVSQIWRQTAWLGWTAVDTAQSPTAMAAFVVVWVVLGLAAYCKVLDKFMSVKLEH